MKHSKSLIVVIAVLFTCVAYAQEMPRHAFSAGGGNYESVVIHVSWTIGQAEAVATSYEPEVILSPGFQQYDDFTVSLPEIEQESSIQVYPNPCSKFVHLNIESGQSAVLSYRLCDYCGRTLVVKAFPQNATSINEIIDLSKMAPGLYNLMVIMEDDNTISYESIKLIRN